MEIKKIDSTTHFGAAERYINFSADFQEFLRGTYTLKEIKSVDIDLIQKKFNIAGFVFGNYVSQEERYFFLFKLEKQLEFLAKISGTDDLGKGILKIGFGADGRPGSLAHFNPSQLYINLNKGGSVYKGILQGENSFVHEYGHFLDFVEGLKDPKSEYHFASESFSKTPNKNNFTKFVAIAANDTAYIDKLYTLPSSKYLTKTVEIFARLFETTVNVLVDNDNKYKKYFTNRYTGDAKYLSADKIRKSDATDLVTKMIAIKKGTIQANLF